MPEPQGYVKVRQLLARSGPSSPDQDFSCSSDRVHVAKANRYDAASVRPHTPSRATPPSCIPRRSVLFPALHLASSWLAPGSRHTPGPEPPRRSRCRCRSSRCGSNAPRASASRTGRRRRSLTKTAAAKPPSMPSLRRPMHRPGRRGGVRRSPAGETRGRTPHSTAGGQSTQPSRTQRSPRGTAGSAGGRWSVGLSSGLIHTRPPGFSRPWATGSVAGQDGFERAWTPSSRIGKRVGGNPSRVRISYPPPLPAMAARRPRLGTRSGPSAFSGSVSVSLDPIAAGRPRTPRAADGDRQTTTRRTRSPQSLAMSSMSEITTTGRCCRSAISATAASIAYL